MSRKQSNRFKDDDIKEDLQEENKAQDTHKRKTARITNIESNLVEDEKNQNKEKSKKKFIIKKIKQFFTFNFCLGTICCFIGLFMLYGPMDGFRTFIITTAEGSMRHQYIEYWFYDQDTINHVMAHNSVIETGETTNTALYNFNNENIDKPDENLETPKPIKYKNEYERQILENPNNEDYKIIEISEKNCDGYLAVIYDPSRIHTVVTQYLGTKGEYLVNMAKRENALVAINGGGFVDPNFSSNGATPLGVTISKGKIMTSASYGGSGGIIGFTESNELVLTKCSSSQAKALGIRDCVTFGPFLIVNGISSEVLGNGGWGQAPRTVIAQRADGIVLFLVVDGRTISKPGADMNDLIEIMERYDVVNAANLDGGTSSVMVVNR